MDNLNLLINTEQTLTNLQTVADKLESIIRLNAQASGVKSDSTGTTSQRQELEKLALSNEKLAQASQKTAESQSKAEIAAVRLAKAQLELAQANDKASQSHQISSTRMAAMTENSKILKQALDDVKKQLQEGIAAGKLSQDQQAKLANQTQLLTTLVNQQQKGFGSLTMELRAGERALQSMREAGLQNTTEFKALQLQTANTRREFNNFAKEQRILSAEAPAIQAMTVAARGLGGAYAAGAGAVALFGDENGKIQKEFEKLIAVMTLLKGLNEFNAAMQQKNAIATAVSVMWNKALTAVYGEEAVAAATATEATGALNIALSAGLILGIGALIAAVIWVGKATLDWVGATQKEIEEQIKLSEATKQTNAAIVEQSEMINKGDQAYKKHLEDRLNYGKLIGMDKYQQLALEKQIAAEEARLAKQQIDNLGTSYTQQTKYRTQLENLTSSKISLEKDHAAAIESGNKRVQEADELLIKSIESKIDAIKGIYDAGEKALTDFAAANIKSVTVDAETAKLAEEEKRKFNLQVTKEKVDAIIHANEQILNNEASTQKQRLNAEKNITAEQIKLIRAEAAERLKDPTLTPMGAKMIEDAENAAISKARIEGKEKLQKINEDYAKRDLKAYYDLRNSMIQTQIDFDKEMLESEASSLMEKLKARQQEIGLEVQLENNHYALEKSRKGLTAMELQTLEAEHNLKVSEITTKGIKDIEKNKGW